MPFCFVPKVGTAHNETQGASLRPVKLDSISFRPTKWDSVALRKAELRVNLGKIKRVFYTFV